MYKQSVTPEQIDALLPQTQCGLCGFKGCMPYAEALANKEALINLCPPGGVKGLLALADLLKEDATSFLEDMQKKSKSSMRAIIREAECIGCTKCIQACPVDAIIGSGKWMHTVLAEECTGCELCVAPCPVDCIDMYEAEEVEDKSNQYRKRYQARLKRLNQEIKVKQNKAVEAKKAYLQEALARGKIKKELNRTS